MEDVLTQAKKAKGAAKILREAGTVQKDRFLLLLAKLLEEESERILEENKKDIDAADGITSAMRKRLELSEGSLIKMAAAVRSLAAFPDPVGEVAKSWTREDGLKISKVRTPIGVIACIFESRPNVIIDVASICIK
mgnify:CR=1 FL=1